MLKIIVVVMVLMVMVAGPVMAEEVGIKSLVIFADYENLQQREEMEEAFVKVFLSESCYCASSLKVVPPPPPGSYFTDKQIIEIISQTDFNGVMILKKNNFRINVKLFALTPGNAVLIIEFDLSPEILTLFKDVDG